MDNLSSRRFSSVRSDPAALCLALRHVFSARDSPQSVSAVNTIVIHSHSLATESTTMSSVRRQWETRPLSNPRSKQTDYLQWWFNLRNTSTSLRKFMYSFRGNYFALYEMNCRKAAYELAAGCDARSGEKNWTQFGCKCDRKRNVERVLVNCRVYSLVTPSNRKLMQDQVL